MKLIDLTHTFDHNMPAYPGDRKSEVTRVAVLNEDGYTAYQIRTGMHIGTHMDAPLHMIDGGKSISDMPVESFFGQGRLIDARGRSKITPDILNNVDIEKGDIALIMTGLDRIFHKPAYYTSHPEVSIEFAEKIAGLGVKIMGLDCPSPDRPPFEVHKVLLRNDILILENLTNLRSLLNVEQFEIIAIPAKFNLDGAPVRVIAGIIDK